MPDTKIHDVLNRTAESYVKLVLSVGQHDGSYVDAYYGPVDYLQEVKSERRTLPEIKSSAENAIAELKSLDCAREEEIVQLRWQYLKTQLQSLIARVEMLEGRKYSFDEEAKALYDANPPSYPESHFQKIISEMNELLPGDGSVSERYDQFKKEFIIPKDKLDSVFKAAITECRQRTKEYIELPENESFTIEYVNDKPWSGYNWYKGGGFSLIQMNTDLPIYIDRAVDLAAHEGYPGHHVYNFLLESILYKKYGWVEASVYALFSPQSLIAEGTANFGIDVVLPGKDRIEFEKKILFPIAGMDSNKTESYYQIHELFLKLGYAGNEAARGYLNDTMTRDEAAIWLVKYALMSPDRALQRTRFFDTYRSYVINYNLGQDLVKRYIEKCGGTPDKPQKRWEEFKKLISSPRLPSGLV
ncbi:MAG: hypothetical protein HZB59_02315 [Ignavibacteriales bacterium]|nr:hypothetical protein [Ignavibacteriales bacterium]